MSCGDIFLGLIAILFPPIAVWIKSGLCSADSFINILLCVLGYLPGLLHAWYIIAKNPEYDYETVPDDEAQQGQNGRVTYYYVSHEQQPQRGSQRQQRGYGTAGNAPSVPKNSRPAPSSRATPTNTAAGPSTSRPSDESGAPPSYADAMGGDHKVQRQE